MKSSSVSIATQSSPVTTSPRQRRCVTSTSLAITSFGCLTRRSPDARGRTSATGNPGKKPRPLARLAQDEEPGVRGREEGGRGGLGQMSTSTFQRLYDSEINFEVSC